jgi:hypothetical protein
MATRRTTMRSRSGTKLYAVRDESGKFKDIQTYKRAHAADLRHKSKAANDEGRNGRGAEGSETSREAGCESAAGGEKEHPEGRQDEDTQAGGEDDRDDGREEGREEAREEARVKRSRKRG